MTARISDDILSGGRAGWPAILSSLKSLLETGQALVNQMAAAGTDAGRAEGDGDRDAVRFNKLVVPAWCAIAHGRRDDSLV